MSAEKKGDGSSVERASSFEKRSGAETRSGASTSPGPDIVTNSALDRRVWLKLDLYMLPVVAMFYLLSFLDRTNIGNARVAGLQRDLGMSDHQYSIALTVTYVPYICAELPSNLLLKRIGPNRMLPTMLTLWGIVTTLQGVVSSFSGLLACRFFLGLLEGGVFPGLVLYLSMFYPRRKMNLRISAFFSSASISGAFSGILAYGIVRIQKGRPGWAWVFIIEGLFTVVFGVVSFFLLPRSPEATRFLTQEEKDYLIAVMEEEGKAAQEATDKFSWREVGKAFTSPHVALMAVMFFLSGVIVFGLGFFTPSIVAGMGFSPVRTQLMTVPPFAAGFAVAMISAYISDRKRCRGIVAIVNSLLAAIGFAMFLGSERRSVQYGSLFFSISGTYAAAPAFAAWSSNNSAPHTRRATAIAISFIMTSCGGILSTWLLGSLSPPPRYTSATITLMVFSIVSAMTAVLNMIYLTVQNRKKEQFRAISNRDQEEPGLGDKSAWFIYNL